MTPATAFVLAILFSCIGLGLVLGGLGFPLTVSIGSGIALAGLLVVVDLWLDSRER